MMRQPQVCKHQVCDHCGGRFGMVTHRWWGNKFCKRTCKGAYLRELALGRDKIRSRYAFFPGGWLTRAAPCRQTKTRSRAGQVPRLARRRTRSAAKSCTKIG